MKKKVEQKGMHTHAKRRPVAPSPINKTIIFFVKKRKTRITIYAYIKFGVWIKDTG